MTQLLILSYFFSPLTWISAAFGAIIGSFLNVCIFRIPEGAFLKHARSVCRGCGQLIPIWYNIPIFSYLYLKGKAHCCKTTISLQYPIVELLTSLMFVWIYWKFPFVIMTHGRLGFDAPELIRFMHAALLVSLLIIVSFIDLRLMIIPDVISLPMIIVTPLIAFLHPDLDAFSALTGVFIGAGVLYVIAWVYYLLRKETGMGAGDVKLLAGLGGWLGYQAIFPIIFYASVLGAFVGILVIVWNRKMSLRSEIPFGPFLAIGAILHLMLGMKLQELIFSL